MARPTKSDAEKLTKTVAFRLAEPDFLAYRKKFSLSGLSQSEFFREHVLGNTTTVVAKATNQQANRAVLLLQKASNNLNQLAYQANSLNLAGQLDQQTFSAILSQLQQLNQFMVDQVGEAQK